MAQIKTIDMFKSYPQTLISKYNHEDFVMQEAEKEKILLQNIKLN